MVAPKFGPHRMWHPACFVCRLACFHLVRFLAKNLGKYLDSDLDFELSSNCHCFSHCGELLVDLTYCVHQVCVKVKRKKRYQSEANLNKQLFHRSLPFHVHHLQTSDDFYPGPVIL